MLLKDPCVSNTPNRTLACVSMSSVKSLCLLHPQTRTSLVEGEQCIGHKPLTSPKALIPQYQHIANTRSEIRESDKGTACYKMNRSQSQQESEKYSVEHLAFRDDEGWPHEISCTQYQHSCSFQESTSHSAKIDNRTEVCFNSK